MSVISWYVVLALVTAVVSTVYLILDDPYEHPFEAALFAILLGIGWPFVWFAVALAVVGNTIARVFR